MVEAPAVEDKIERLTEGKIQHISHFIGADEAAFAHGISPLDRPALRPERLLDRSRTVGGPLLSG
jgi:hypothetical protein